MREKISFFSNLLRSSKSNLIQRSEEELQAFETGETSWTKKTPTSLLFLSFCFYNQEKRHSDLATVKLDKEYSLLGDCMYF